jgi:alanyl-tRNA synthetase
LIFFIFQGFNVTLPTFDNIAKLSFFALKPKTNYMTSNEIRQQFLDFFKSKSHKIVASAPIVVKNDPTLMFTNAGMNQFKDYFLGNKTAVEKRIANSQKCLRVSGKHNDLEEVGVDTYHHTMFEMLGNWSFGDYFKKDAINWAWELLTEVYGLDVNRLYVTVFEGSKDDNLDYDLESYELWSKLIDPERILRGNKKDNFWEMGETGPCGPCSEIHFDLRPDLERFETPGKLLVNNDHPQVIEIWNLVFMQYNRKSDGSLENLPDMHVDTGMGFERLVRVIHGKSSNYDTDIFLDTIQELEIISNKKYGETEQIDIAFRVIADHLRAICFAIADGQLPANNGAGYVIRRILRRAVRYGYSYLNFKEAEIYKLVKPLAKKFEKVFPELNSQLDFVSKVVLEEEKTFMNTLSKGIEILNTQFETLDTKIINGKAAFELYDTFGFPIDLTRLISSEKGFAVDEVGFEIELQQQKARSRKDAEKTTGDWTFVSDDDLQEFIGYDYTEAISRINRFRTVNSKGIEHFQVVLSNTPFYAESGGQVGDTGILEGESDLEIVRVLNTVKENNLMIQTLDKLPQNLNQNFKAKVDFSRRQNITKNHSATHLLHAALKQVLGNHIAQKGSLVEPDRLRFDFSHFSKISDAEIESISKIVKQKISDGIELQEKRNIPIKDALEMGATALFGEKYGDSVRVIIFDRDFSMELCGGTHVKNTLDIGNMIITAETAVAAGVRRIEAITGTKAEDYISERLNLLEAVETEMGKPKELLKAIGSIMTENHNLKKQIEQFEIQQTNALKTNLKTKIKSINGANTIIETIEISNADQLKDLCFQLKNETENLFAVFGCVLNHKPMLSVTLSENLITDRGWNASQLIREWAKSIEGGGGGQAFFATAGGKKIEGIESALNLAKNFINA